MNSWQVKFNYEIIHYRHFTYYICIFTQLSVKWLFFCLEIPKKFQEQEPYLAKMSISGQTVSEMLAGIYTQKTLYKPL